MKDVLKDLYHGNIRPEENNQPEKKELIAARRVYAAHREKFLSDIEDETLRRNLMDLLDERNELFADEMEECYVQGMRMGARMAVALLGEKSA